MSIGRGLLYVATAAGFGLLLRTILIGPLSLWVALPAMALYLGVVLLGALWPPLEMFSDIVWHGPQDRAEVALTFDDGPHPVHTVEVLDQLDRAGAQATFFVIGKKVAKHPQIAAEIAKRGHLIGIHSHVHDRFLALRGTQRIVDDLTRAVEAVRTATGTDPSLFRPPIGITSPRVDEAARRLGLTVVAWSVRGCDGLAGASPDRVARRIARRVRPGSIVQMHDDSESGDRPPVAPSALPRVLEAMAAKGLRPVRLDVLVTRD